MSVGRNETCPCGSGKKFKVCCAGKSAQRTSRGLMLLLGTLAIIAAVGIVASMRDDDEKRRTPVPVAAAPVNVPGPQPPGPVPPGKVWSKEHGHWHDQAPANPIQIQQTSPIQTQQSAVTPAPALTPGPQPPGPVPPGKVWSQEHGHWHDAPAR